MWKQINELIKRNEGRVDSAGAAGASGRQRGAVAHAAAAGSAAVVALHHPLGQPSHSKQRVQPPRVPCFFSLTGRRVLTDPSQLQRSPISNSFFFFIKRSWKCYLTIVSTINSEDCINWLSTDVSYYSFIYTWVLYFTLPTLFHKHNISLPSEHHTFVPPKLDPCLPS